MKLTTLFVLFTSLQLSANMYSQSSKITLNVSNGTLSDIFKEIEKQTEYKIFYKVDQIDLQARLTVTADNLAVSEVLSKVLSDGNTYDLIDKIIVITPSVKQSIKVSGTVTDSKNLALPGVSITVLGTNKGTITDVDGKYSIEVPDGNAVLQFSYLGYVVQEKTVGNQTSINVIMNEDIKVLDEVVVVGYGTQKKSDVTGALIRVGESELKSRPVNNVIEALQGKATGVDITSSERPGEVGQINIRGVRSLTASSTPLYVVDGIPLMNSSSSTLSQFGIESLNPADIEAIDVLKDASATAIYGSRGANGVILVTTKKGKAGKLSFNYSGTVTIETLQDRQKMMNSDEYITWRRWGYYYLDPVNNPRGDQPTIAKDYIYFLGAKDPSAWKNIMKGWASGTWAGSKVPTYDWTGQAIQTAVTTEHNISASGGTDKMKAYASFGYLDNPGTLKGQSYTRYTGKASVDLNPIKWFEMGLSVNTASSTQEYGSGSPAANQQASIYAAANANLPYTVPFDSLGNRILYPGGDDVIKNSINEDQYGINERKILRVIGSAYAQLNLLPGLKYRLNFGPDFRYYQNGVYTDALSTTRIGLPNFASINNQRDFSWTLDNLIYYDKKIGNHTFGATLLQSASAQNTTLSTISAQNIPVPDMKWNALNATYIPSANLTVWNSDLIDKTLTSYMWRLNYGYADKYLLTVSGRWDGASQLASGHKWSFFPSAALGWRIDKEDWLKNVTWVNQLKLRLGVGVTGNSAINPYQTKGGIVSLFYPYGASPTAGYVPSESLVTGGNLPLANPLLGWEKTTQYNLGFDFSLIKSRVSGTIDLYSSQTKDLLMQMSIPALTGYTISYGNIGETKNKGIDITLNTVNVKTKDFEWATIWNAAYQKEEIVSLSNGKSDDISNLWFIGQQVGVIYGYQSNGLWHDADAAEMAKFNANGSNFQVGMARPVDQNGDYKIDANHDRVIIGHTRPLWTVGLTNTFTYKNFDLSIFLFGRLNYTFNTGGEAQLGRYVQREINYYNENNKNAEYQKPINNVGGADPYFNILGYRDGSFIKIRDISLGYTLPASWAKKLSLQTVKLYVQAKNPGMIFSNVPWVDMDLSHSGNGSSTDLTTQVTTWNRGFVFGLNVGF